MSKDNHFCPKCHSQSIIMADGSASCILCGYFEQGKTDESPVPISNDILVLAHKHKRK